MNSVPNSDSKQCPESKLGWVHTLGPGCVHVEHWAGRVVVHQAPYRRPPPVVSWPSSLSCRSAHWSCRRLYRRSCRKSCHALCRTPCHRAPARAAMRRVAASLAMSRASQPYYGACPAVSQHCIATHPTARPSSCHDTNDCIVTHLNGQTAFLSRCN